MDETKKEPAVTKPVAVVQPLPAGRSPYSQIIFGVVIFTCGVIVGLALSALLIHRGVVKAVNAPAGIDPAVMTRHLDKRLGLTPAQKTAIEDILTEELATINTRRQEISAEMITQFETIRDRVSAELTDEQRELWLSNIESVRNKFAPLRRGRGSGNSPGTGNGAGRGRGMPGQGRGHLHEVSDEGGSSSADETSGEKTGEE